MPRAGVTLPTGTNFGWAANVPADELVGYWCGPDDAYCKRTAARLALMDKPVMFLDGHFGKVKPEQEADAEFVKAHRAATIEAMGRYVYHCGPFEVINDDENPDLPAKVGNLASLLHRSGLLPRGTASSWAVYDGDGEQYDEHGLITKSPNRIEGGPTVVHGYLRYPDGPPELKPIGVSLDDQVDRIVEAAKAAYGPTIALVTGTRTDQEGTPFPAYIPGDPFHPDFHGAMRRLLPALAEYVDAWWLYNPVAILKRKDSREIQPLFAQPWEPSVKVHYEKAVANPGMNAATAVGNVWNDCAAWRYPDYAAIEAEMTETVGLIRGR